MISDNPLLDHHVTALRKIIERDPHMRDPLRTFAQIILDILDDEDAPKPAPKKRRADA